MNATNTLVVDSHVISDDAHLISARNSNGQALTGSIRRLLASLDAQGDLQGMLQSLPETLAEYFNAKSCWISFTDELRGGRATSTESYIFPEGSEYSDELTRERERDLVAEHTLGCGKSLLINGVAKWGSSEKKDRSSDIDKSIIVSPILVRDRVIGEVHVKGPRHKCSFDEEDLSLLEAITLFLANSIRALRLQRLLDSRLLQMALEQPDEKSAIHIPVGSVHRLDKMARIVAKSFFREMAKAGFGSKQVINAISEIISELNESLRTNNKQQ